MSLSDVFLLEPLKYSFSKLESPSVATQALSILAHNKVYSPQARIWKDYLKQHSVRVSGLSDSIHEESSLEYQNHIHQIASRAIKDSFQSNAFTKTPDQNTLETSAQLYAKIKKAVHLSVLEHDYTRALQYLNDFSTIVIFSSQPKDHPQLRENLYIEFLFYQFLINIHHSLWFQYEDHRPSIFRHNSHTLNGNSESPTDSGGSAPTSAGTIPVSGSSNYKALDSIYKKVVAYYNRNESLLLSCPDENDDKESSKHEDVANVCDELKYYWLVRIFNLTILFKRLQFDEFYSEFISLIGSKQVLRFFVSETSIFKSKILSMFAIVLIFLKPFNELSLIEFDKADIMLNLFTSDEDSFEFQLYNKVLLSLSESKFPDVIQVFSSAEFGTKFLAELGFCIPTEFKERINAASQGSQASFPFLAERSSNLAFLYHIGLIITFKNTLLILSITKQIPRIKLLQLLGYNTEESSDQELNAIHSNILLLISSLGLGKLGIGYKFDDDVYYNVGPNRTKDVEDLQEELDELTNELKSESVANMMKGALLEKLFG